MGASPDMAIDPRLFPQRVRYAALLTVNVYVFMGNMYSAGLATGFNFLGADLRVSYQKLSDLVTWSVLSMGLGNLFWMPLALCFGKRPAVLVSMTMFLTGTIWSAVAKDYGSLLGSRIFASFGYGASESLGPSILADLFYERHYASAMAVYAAFLSGGSQVGPVIAGYLIQARGWRWFFILCAIIAAVNLCTTFFMLPETLYEEERREVSGDPEKSADNNIEAVRSGTSQPSATAETCQRSSSMDCKAYWKGLFTLGISKAARQTGPVKYLVYLFCLPFPLLLIPGVLLASIMYGIVLGGVVAISTLAASLFSPTPYLFSAPELGLFTLSSFIGIVIAWPIAGPLTDRLSHQLRKRNNNIHEPEHRLPALIIPFIICPLGLVVFGYTVSRQQHYVRPAVGQAMAAAGLALVPSVMLSYVVDGYPQMSGGALVLVNASKNVVAFGLAKGSYTWMAREGVGVMFYEMAGILWAVILLALPLYFAGGWIRARTAEAKVLSSV